MSDRQRIVDEAEKWLNTPYHPHGRVLGAGVDCVMLLAEVYERAGAVPHIEPGHYSVQLGLHSEDEILEAFVLQYGREVETPEPGDCVLFKFGRSYSHGGIMVSPIRFIHASGNAGMVCYTDLSDGEVAGRDRRFYTVGAS